MNQELAQSQSPDTVRMQRLLPGPIERVWAYLTESDKRRTWLAQGDMDLRTGGAVQLTWFNGTLSTEPTPPRFAGDEGYSMQGKIVACEPPHVLVFTWPQGGVETEVRFELEARGEQVLLILTHSRLANRKQRVGVASGWDAHVAVLEQRLAGGDPIGFWSYHARVEAEYEARL